LACRMWINSSSVRVEWPTVQIVSELRFTAPEPSRHYGNSAKMGDSALR
jgi:hypothetical protein